MDKHSVTCRALAKIRWAAVGTPSPRSELEVRDWARYSGGVCCVVRAYAGYVGTCALDLSLQVSTTTAEKALSCCKRGAIPRTTSSYPNSPEDQSYQMSPNHSIPK
ncbi:hypothetical protein PCH_Pc16g12500 [Penicillium rubens Wisconsin 54-1255]|uniref:Uncharacterized protein n=1 Tax=Penicillium rubens (strain ATCC 28089 / DSM 1075 / NRRL 1951 / Wisconsin 54-1255) TaxID=500485 RepID=B6HAE1_PENRW|nr:hypothetical protein PCH_Pc16g12500 [Penicillium rubens Wisconsin 54-1255]